MRSTLLLILFVIILRFDVAGQEIVAIGDSTLNIAADEVTLTGTVTDSVTNETLAGVNVSIIDSNKGTITDSSGVYTLSLAPGKYQLQFQYISRETVAKDIIIYSSGRLNIEMQEKPFELDEIIVEENQAEDNVLSVIPGVENLSISDIEEIPAFLGEVDVVNSLVSLPGVTTIGEGASGFNIRGGRVDQNLILMEGVHLFNSSHVLGLFSIFNPDVTDNFTLYKGHIPARYGGRLSSVLDVNLKKESFSEYKVNAGVGVASTRLSLQGPVSQGKTSFLLAGRSSYSDWILQLVKNTDVKQSQAFFFDANAIATHQFNKDSNILLSLYGSHDYFRFSDQFGYRWNNQTANITWNRNFSERMASEFSAAYGVYNASYFTPTGIDAFELDTGIRYYNFKENIFYKPVNTHSINAGIEWTTYNQQPEKIRPYNSNSTVESRNVEKDQARELSVYASDDITLLPGWEFSLGLRYTFFQSYGPARKFSYESGVPKSTATITDTTFYENGEIITADGGLEPRVSSRLSLSSSSSIKLSYNRTRQYIHLISNTTSPTPANIWQVSTRHMPAKSANNYSFGFFKNFSSDTWETSAELFYREINDLVEYKDFAELFLNDHIETELLTGNGQAYGSELSVKKTSGKWTGWLSYAYSRTFVKVKGETLETSINNGEWFPSSYDQPHNFDLVVKRRLGKRSAFSFNFTYRTGRPISALTSSYVDDPTSIPIFSERNEYRVPDYIRLDISFTIAENIWKGRTVDPNRRYKDSMTISFYNLFSRDNAFSVFYRRPAGATSSLPRAHKLSVLGAVIPSVTYNFSF